jgi:hypothetical protein
MESELETTETRSGEGFIWAETGRTDAQTPANNSFRKKGTFTFITPRFEHMAGILTRSGFRGLPIRADEPLTNSGISSTRTLQWSLQQRDCSGISPDSHLITTPRGFVNQCFAKVQIQLLEIKKKYWHETAHFCID